jgi:glycosyltransferase 2 family protein
MKGPSSPSRWLWRLCRYGLIVVAIGFLYRSVTWYDHVHLNDADKTLVRLVGRSGNDFVVLQDGREITKHADEISHVDVHGLRTPDIEYGARRVLSESDGGLALWAVLMFAPVPLLCAVRLVWMVAVQQVHVSLWDATKLTFLGNFFNFALPGTTGGDVIKAYYIARLAHRKTEAITSIFLDRAIGLLSLVLMAGAMIVFTQDPSQFSDLATTLAIICAVLAAGTVVVFSGRIRRALRLRELLMHLPMHEQLFRVGGATIAMRHHKLLVVLSFLLTLVLQGVCLVSAGVMAQALGMKDDFSYVFINVCIGFLIAAIPSTPQAIGVMESFYVVAFAYRGSSASSQALALALAVRLIQLVWSLPGVLVLLLGGHPPDRAELAELEKWQEGATDRPANDLSPSGDSSEPDPA